MPDGHIKKHPLAVDWRKQEMRTQNKGYRCCRDGEKKDLLGRSFRGETRQFKFSSGASSETGMRGVGPTSLISFREYGNGTEGRAI